MLIAFENRIVQQSCLDVSYADSIAQLRDTSAAAAGVGYRQWVYQTCTEFGYFQTSDSGTDRPASQPRALPLIRLCPHRRSALRRRHAAPVLPRPVPVLYLFIYLL
jgi:hypothetical protein